MRSIQIVPGSIHATSASHKSQEEIDALASRVCEAVIDLGAKLVTVPETDAGTAAVLATAIANALSSDLLTGVIVVSGVDNVESLSATIEAAGSGKQDKLDDIEYLGALAIIRTASGGAPTKLATQLTSFRPQPVLVSIGTEPIGFPSEVVVTCKSMQLGAAQPLTRKGA